MAKRLILNADDLGYDKETNETVEALVRAGLVTAVSLLAPAPAAEDAAQKMRSLGFAVGAHLSLQSDDKSALWTGLSGAKGLEALPGEMKALTFGVTRAAAKTELAAQFAFPIARGLKADHVDAHAGALYGLALRRFSLDAFALAGQAGLPFRFPKTPDFFLRQTGFRFVPAVKALHKVLLRQAKKQKVLLPDDVFSDPRAPDRIASREELFSYYLRAVENCREGVTEIFLHPRADDAVPGTAWAKRNWEYELLKSRVLHDAAAKNGVKIVTPEEAYK